MKLMVFSTVETCSETMGSCALLGTARQVLENLRHRRAGLRLLDIKAGKPPSSPAAAFDINSSRGLRRKISVLDTAIEPLPVRATGCHERVEENFARFNRDVQP